MHSGKHTTPRPRTSSQVEFTQTRFQIDTVSRVETAWKSMRFESVYTEPFSYSLRHTEVITD